VLVAARRIGAAVRFAVMLAGGLVEGFARLFTGAVEAVRRASR
jgi:hypothetical protein